MQILKIPLINYKFTNNVLLRVLGFIPWHYQKRKVWTNPDLHRERTEVHHVFKNLHSKKLSQITIPAEGEGT